MLMVELPDGALQKNKRHLQGHQYPKNQKFVKKAWRDVTGAIKQPLLSDDKHNVNDDD